MRDSEFARKTTPFLLHGISVMDMKLPLVPLQAHIGGVGSQNSGFQGNTQSTGSCVATRFFY